MCVCVRTCVWDSRSDSWLYNLACTVSSHLYSLHRPLDVKLFFWFSRGTFPARCDDWTFSFNMYWIQRLGLLTFFLFLFQLSIMTFFFSFFTTTLKYSFIFFLFPLFLNYSSTIWASLSLNRFRKRTDVVFCVFIRLTLTRFSFWLDGIFIHCKRRLLNRVKKINKV